MADTIKRLLYVIPIQVAPGACKAKSVLDRIDRNGRVCFRFVRKIAHYLLLSLLEDNADKRLVDMNC